MRNFRCVGKFISGAAILAVTLLSVGTPARAATSQTLFTTQSPGSIAQSDGGVNYELGTQVQSSTSGQITAIRFWKDANESATHTGHIWSGAGQLLGSVTFANETASGWQQQALGSPISIAANTTYVVSVNTGNSFYVATTSGLASQIVNGNLRSVVGNNGVYGNSGAFPTNSWQSSNYFRDVVFVPATTIAITYSISGTVGSSSNGPGTMVTLSGAASVTTTADSAGNYTFAGLANGSYTITPAKPGFTFSPANVSTTISSANITGLNFTATAVVTTYSISGTIGPSSTGPGTTVTLSGAASATGTADSAGNYSFAGLANGSYTVTPSKAGFTYSPATAAANVNNSNVNVATFTATAIPVGQTLFTTQVPIDLGQSDGASVNYELGTLLQSNAAGQITSIRFWKDTKESGTHTGHIWSAAGQLLASATFVNETASGWQQQALATPLTIAANTTYVASVNTGNSYYVSTTSGLASQVTNGNLSSVVGNNGMYGNSGAFPANSWQSSNYFRDVVFVPSGTTTATAPTISSQPAGKTISAGQTATFNVAATGTSPMTYQWMKNTVAISGATLSSYTTPAETTADNNAQFTVKISNSMGSATSNPAILTVNAATLVLNASSSALSFGNVTLAVSSTQNVTLTNAGTSSVTISNVSISGAGFSASGVPAGLILSAGQTTTLTVTFAPASTGSVTGSVTVTSNASNSPAKVTLSGTGVTAVVHSAALSWVPSTSTVVGYNCYSGTVSGGPYTKLNTLPIALTSYTDLTVQSGKTYYYVVTSVDSNNVESAFSSQVSASIP